ncbi:unnamed protein product [Durusdinium trenchii]|uniref:Uncharacterized protein n=1 Tax=Durusdinium trenchii TaxID=1381693 RepID=A0ABP0HUX4_9DINO
MAKRLINENEEGRSGDLTSGAQPGRSSGRAHRGRSSGRHRRSRSRRERKDRGKTSRGRRESSRSRSPQGEEPGSESASEDMDPETQMSSLALQLGLNMATLKLKTKKQIKVEDLAPEAIIFVLAQPPGCTTKLPQLSTYTLHETGGELFALRQAAAARLKKKGEESKRSQQCEEMVCAEEAVLRKWKSRLCEIYEQLATGKSRRTHLLGYPSLMALRMSTLPEIVRQLRKNPKMPAQLEKLVSNSVNAAKGELEHFYDEVTFRSEREAKRRQEKKHKGEQKSRDRRRQPSKEEQRRQRETRTEVRQLEETRSTRVEKSEKVKREERGARKRSESDVSRSSDSRYYDPKSPQTPPEVTSSDRDIFCGRFAEDFVSGASRRKDESAGTPEKAKSRSESPAPDKAFAKSMEDILIGAVACGALSKDTQGFACAAQTGRRSQRGSVFVIW